MWSFLHDQRINLRKDSSAEIAPLINTGVWMFLWLNQSRAKLIRLLHQHVGWKRDRGRGLGGDSVMRSQPPYPHLCGAPFYIFRFPENVHEWVFANVWLYRSNCGSHQGNMLFVTWWGFFRFCLEFGSRCHCQPPGSRSQLKDCGTFICCDLENGSL